MEVKSEHLGFIRYFAKYKQPKLSRRRSGIFEARRKSRMQLGVPKSDLDMHL
jgi:hypothetical protein